MDATLTLSSFDQVSRYVTEIVEGHGAVAYLIVFLIIFAETGLVVTAVFTPGDSLLFAAGALAAAGVLDAGLLAAAAVTAAIGGYALSYELGRLLGPKIVKQSRFFRVTQEAVDRARTFLARNGGRATVLARFVPGVRSVAPFVAGLSGMRFGRFMAHNVIGGVLWVGAITSAGYLFGSLPFVRSNFGLLLLGVAIFSAGLLTLGLLGASSVRHKPAR